MNMIWAGIRLLLMIVLLGYAMVWIMRPTKTFKEIWLPNIRKKLNSSTYFGTQGLHWLIFPVHSTKHWFYSINYCISFPLARQIKKSVWNIYIKCVYILFDAYFATGTGFLVFSFPILFVAVVGCVYLHFRKRSDDSKLER